MTFESEVSNWKYSNFLTNKRSKFSKKDIKVSYADGQLSIESIKSDKAKEKDENGIPKSFWD